MGNKIYTFRILTKVFINLKYIQGQSRISPAIVKCNENGLCNMDVTWQPRRVDWNAHA